MKETFDEHKVLSRDVLRELMTLTNKEAAIRIIIQMSMFVGTVFVLAYFQLSWYGLAAALFVLGWMIWSLYAPLHECSHGTAFKSKKANFVVSWITGIIFGYSPGLHVAFHFKHHRTTNKDDDPERGFDLPEMPFRMLFFVVIGAVLGLLIPVHTFLLSFIPTRYWDKFQAEWTRPSERAGLQRGAWIVTACWAGAFFLMALHSWLWLYMIVGLVIGRLINAFVTVSEHQGRHRDGHMLRRSRSVKSNRIVSWFWWNLNYHAEHHTWPTIPFHQLPKLQKMLEERGATHISKGYFSFYKKAEYKPENNGVVSPNTQSELPKPENIMSKSFYCDKVVWVTGASSGIGRALAKAFSAAGTKLVISARREDVLKKVAQECAFPEKVMVLPLDLCEPESMTEKVREVIEHFGSIDFLINNAGIGQRSHIDKTSLKMYDHVMRVNYLGTVALTQAALRHFSEQGHGHITVISSVLGRIAVSERSSYAASKSAINAFFDTIRVEYRKQNVQVLLVLSGGVQTAIDLNAMDGKGNRLNALPDDYDVAMSPEKFAQSLMRAIRRGKKEVVIGNMEERMGVMLRKYLPSVYHRLAP